MTRKLKEGFRLVMVWPISYVLSSSWSSIYILKKYISNVSRLIMMKLHLCNGKGYISCKLYWTYGQHKASIKTYDGNSLKDVP